MPKHRYSNYDYQKTLIVNGTLELFGGGVPLDRIQDADLVVCVKGNAFVVVKDRFGTRSETEPIDAAQLSDIRENLPNVEIIDTHGKMPGLFARTG